MREGEGIGVEGLAAKRRERVPGHRGKPAGLGLKAGAVGRIAHDRVADMGQVDADLVGAAGLERASQ